MSVIDILVTNRTQADVTALAAALARCSGGTGTAADYQMIRATSNKGAYGAEDMNRVGAALDYMVGRLNAEAGMALSAINLKKDWTEADEPTASQLAYYLQLVHAVRNALKAPASTPALPASLAGLTVSGANSIEQCLVDIDSLITKMAAASIHCGLPRCGGTGGIM